MKRHARQYATVVLSLHFVLAVIVTSYGTQAVVADDGTSFQQPAHSMDQEDEVNAGFQPYMIQHDHVGDGSDSDDALSVKRNRPVPRPFFGHHELIYQPADFSGPPAQAYATSNGSSDSDGPTGSTTDSSGLKDTRPQTGKISGVERSDEHYRDESQNASPLISVPPSTRPASQHTRQVGLASPWQDLSIH